MINSTARQQYIVDELQQCDRRAGSKTCANVQQGHHFGANKRHNFNYIHCHFGASRQGTSDPIHTLTLPLIVAGQCFKLPHPGLTSAANSAIARAEMSGAQAVKLLFFRHDDG